MISRPLLRQAQNSRAALGLTLACSLAGGGLAVAQAWLLAQVIAGAFLGGPAPAAIARQLALLLAVIAIRAAVVAGGEVAAGYAAIRVKTDLRNGLFEHLLALGPAYSQGERTGELTATLVEGVESLDAYIGQYLPQLATAALVPLTVLLVVFPLDPLSALVLCLTAPLIPLFMFLIGKAVEALTKRQFDLLGRLSAHFLDVMQGLATLKQLNQSRAQARVLERLGDQYRIATMNVLRVAFLSALALELLATISTAIVAVEAGLRLLYGRLDFPLALFLLILAPEFYLPLRLLGQRFHAAAPGLSAARRIFEILAVPAPAPHPTRSASAAPPLPAAPEIVFREVHFAYGNDRPALNGVTFQIPAGRKTALAGPSGAGKTTLLNLLMRFSEPAQGEIWVDGRPLAEWPAAAWREQIAWVPQSPHLFYGSVAANIRLAQPAASSADVVRAAQQAHLHEFIQSLPQGYDTPVGEHGARLSGGQAQRLALARAFLKNAPLLLLDEPTSQLDPELELWLQDSVDRLLGETRRTVLVIAHRLSTIYQADQIVVLADGRVAQSGTHQSLLAEAGLYRQWVLAAPPLETA